MKFEDAVNHGTIVTGWLKKFHSGCKNLDDQARSVKVKTADSKAVLQAQSAGAVAYTNCKTSTTHECPGYDTKQSD